MVDNLVYFMVLSPTGEFLGLRQSDGGALTFAPISAESNLSDFYYCRREDNVSLVRQRILEETGRHVRTKSGAGIEGIIRSAKVMADW